MTRYRFDDPRYGQGIMFVGAAQQPQQILVLTNEDMATQVWIELFGDQAAAEGTRRPNIEGATVESEEYFDTFGGLQWSEPARATLSDPERELTRRRLAVALADRLRPAVPPGWPDGGLVFWLYGYFGIAFEDPENSLEDAVLFGAGSALHQLPDDIAEDTTEPWPPRRTPADPPFAEAELAIEHGELRVWFGYQDDPVLTLEPIPIGEIGL